MARSQGFVEQGCGARREKHKTVCTVKPIRLTKTCPRTMHRTWRGGIWNHRRHRNSRSALPITIRSEAPMAAAQKTGLRKPSAASGTPTTL